MGREPRKFGVRAARFGGVCNLLTAFGYLRENSAAPGAGMPGGELRLALAPCRAVGGGRELDLFGDQASSPPAGDISRSRSRERRGASSRYGRVVQMVRGADRSGQRACRRPGRRTRERPPTRVGSVGGRSALSRVAIRAAGGWACRPPRRTTRSRRANTKRQRIWPVWLPGALRPSSLYRPAV